MNPFKLAESEAMHEHLISQLRLAVSVFMTEDLQAALRLVEEKERFRTLIPELARQRDLFWLSSEGSGNSGQRGLYLTILTAFQHGRSTAYQLAYSHPHGAWLEWLDRTEET